MFWPHSILLLFAALFFPALASLLDEKNCGQDSFPCGPTNKCCANGYFCNYNTGIPSCEQTEEYVLSGAGGPICPSGDVYLYDCSLFGIEGSCCEIGNLCFSSRAQQGITCIDAYGNSTKSYSSTTTGVTPPATLVNDTGSNIIFAPPNAWNPTLSKNDCAFSQTIRSTSTLNASISYNYTGPSIRINTLTSSNGGVFSLFVDGYNTDITIDTLTTGSQPLPLCYPQQFPPFPKPPPDYARRESHVATLIYIGPSPNAPNGTNSSIVQFDSFAIPDLLASSAYSNYDSISFIKFTGSLGVLGLSLLTLII